MSVLRGITRFRVEAKGETKQDVIDQLDDAFISISKALNDRKLVGTGTWECMDDVVARIKSPAFKTLDQRTLQEVVGYSGRRVFTFRPWSGK